MSFFKKLFGTKETPVKQDVLKEEDIKKDNKPLKVLIVDIVDGKEVEYKSLRECSKKTGISRYIIRKHIKNEEVYQGLTFRYI